MTISNPLGKVVQLIGAIRSIIDAYTGPPRELTVDESNWDLRLHDGATPGGRIILNRDNADSRYQGRSPELDGLTGFEPQQRGILVRLGPSSYRLRTLTVNEDNLALNFGNGYGGNPYLSIAAVIASEHTWNGQQVFNAVVNFTAGINADVSGDTFGTHAGPVTGNVTGNLTGNSTGTHTGPQIGDVDTRGHTLLLDDNQIGTAKINGLNQYVRDHARFLGEIVMWSGAIVDIPAGWKLCDGANSTPDLRNRFIVGAGSTYAPFDTGGAATHIYTGSLANAGSHTHNVTVDSHVLTLAEIPAHKHGNGTADNGSTSSIFTHGTFPVSSPDSIANNPASGTLEGWTSTDGGGTGHNHTASVDAQGTHTHALTMDSANTLPPYFALCFIMRVAD